MKRRSKFFIVSILSLTIASLAYGKEATINTDVTPAIISVGEVWGQWRGVLEIPIWANTSASLVEDTTLMVREEINSFRFKIDWRGNNTSGFDEKAIIIIKLEKESYPYSGRWNLLYEKAEEITSKRKSVDLRQFLTPTIIQKEPEARYKFVVRADLPIGPSSGEKVTYITIRFSSGSTYTCLPYLLLAILHDPSGDKSYTGITPKTTIEHTLGLKIGEAAAVADIQPEFYLKGSKGKLEFRPLSRDSIKVIFTPNVKLKSELNSSDSSLIGPGLGDVYIIAKNIPIKLTFSKAERGIELYFKVVPPQEAGLPPGKEFDIITIPSAVLRSYEEERPIFGTWRKLNIEPDVRTELIDKNIGWDNRVSDDELEKVIDLGKAYLNAKEKRTKFRYKQYSLLPITLKVFTDITPAFTNRANIVTQHGRTPCEILLNHEIPGEIIPYKNILVELEDKDRKATLGDFFTYHVYIDRQFGTLLFITEDDKTKPATLASLHCRSLSSNPNEYWTGEFEIIEEIVIAELPPPKKEVPPTPKIPELPPPKEIKPPIPKVEIPKLPPVKEEIIEKKPKIPEEIPPKEEKVPVKEEIEEVEEIEVVEVPTVPEEVPPTIVEEVVPPEKEEVLAKIVVEEVKEEVPIKVPEVPVKIPKVEEIKPKVPEEIPPVKEEVVEVPKIPEKKPIPPEKVKPEVVEEVKVEVTKPKPPKEVPELIEKPKIVKVPPKEKPIIPTALLNSDFSLGLKYWDKIETPGGKKILQVIYDTRKYPKVLEFKRIGRVKEKGKLGVCQSLNMDVSKCTSLIVEADVKIIFSSLNSDEGKMYPVMIELEYEDTEGNLGVWTHGFLSDDLFRKKIINYPEIGEKIPKNKWFSYSSPDLMQVLSPKPKLITKLKIYGAGMGFKARVDNIKLVAKEVPVEKPPLVAKVAPEVEVPPPKEEVPPVEVEVPEEVPPPPKEVPIEVPPVEEVKPPVPEEVPPVKVEVPEEVPPPPPPKEVPVEVPPIEEVKPPVPEEIPPVKVEVPEEVPPPPMKEVPVVEVPPVEEIIVPLPELTNGDFIDGLEHWQRFEIGPGKKKVAVIKESAKYPHVLEFKRTKVRKKPGKLGVRQLLDMDVSEYVYLVIKADVKVIYASLRNDGTEGGDYPVTIELEYEDAQGNIKSFKHGFLYRKQINYPKIGECIPKRKWYTYTSPNLIDIITPKPRIIKGIKIYGSGLAFEGRVANVQLICKETLPPVPEAPIEVAAVPEVKIPEKPPKITTVPEVEKPIPPIKPPKLLVNGDFTIGLRNWEKIESGKGINKINIMKDSDEYPNVLEFTRVATEEGKLGVSQSLWMPVANFISLVLMADIKIIYSSFFGDKFVEGGYPVILELEYIDVEGNRQLWSKGFKYHGKITSPEFEEMVKEKTWHQFTSKNLMKQLLPKPDVITKINIYGSGWGFWVRVANIQLIGE